eukprot:jgi/Mesen1/802/ME000110S_11070
MAEIEFRHNGVLLPFGAFNVHHKVANKLLLDPSHGWTLSNNADPLESRPIEDVLASGKRYDVPSNDLYGSLFFHVRDCLCSFVQKLKAMPTDVHFHLTCCDARELAKKLAERRVVLDRVDVSNACDHIYMGIARAEEERGVLLTSFMNWIQAAPGLDPESGMTKEDREKAVRALASSRSFKIEALGASTDKFRMVATVMELVSLY